VHEPSQKKSHDSKGSCFEQLEHVFNSLPKYYTQILLIDFNTNFWKEDIFKPTIENGSPHQHSNDNGVRIVNFVTPKNRVEKSTIFRRQNIHEHNGTSPDGKIHNKTDHILIGER
jgi:hypothetical protein